MRDAIVQLKALGYFCDTLLRATWRRRGVGLGGLIRFQYLGLRSLVLVPLGIAIFGKKALMFMSAYAWFRRVDDVIDGDAPLLPGYTMKLYMDEKQRAFERMTGDGEDVLLLHLKCELQKRGLDAIDGLSALWSVLRWSCEMQQNGRLPERKELDWYAQMQDRAFFEFSAKIFGYDKGRLAEVLDIFGGIFTKLGWLRDIDHDLRKGIAAIPHDAFGVSTSDIVQRAKAGGFGVIKNEPDVARWYLEEAHILSLKWRSVKHGLGDDLGGIFLHKRFARFAQRLIDREIARVFLDIAQQAASLRTIESPFAHTAR